MGSEMCIRDRSWIVYCESPTTTVAGSPRIDAFSMSCEWSGANACQLASVAFGSCAGSRSSHCHTVAAGSAAASILMSIT